MGPLITTLTEKTQNGGFLRQLTAFHQLITAVQDSLDAAVLFEIGMLVMRKAWA